ncbi:copper homeostasis periplasmic binding protein CopC [Ewingella sp. S1.OA.A_B6]
MSKKSSSLCRVLATTAILVTGLISQQAFAHAHLKTETPAADTTLKTAPTELSLGFSEGIEPNFSQVTITGPDKKTVSTGALALAANDNTQAIVPLTSTLSVGKYNVSWHVVSVDGHKTEGQYSFTVK